MATSVSLNGTTYTIPRTGESSWSATGGVDDYLVALATGVLQKAGGSFTLTAEVDFGASYAIKALYLKSRAASVAAAGVVRLGNTETISWRNAANSADLALSANASNVLEFNGNPVVTLALGAADTGLVMNAGGTAYTWAKIANANIDAAAAIALAKLAALTASRALVSDGSGVISASAVTATELGYLPGVTSAVQTQISANATAIAGLPSATQTLTNKIISGASNTITNVSLTTGVTGTLPLTNGGTGQTSASDAINALVPTQTGKSGQVLTTDGSAVSWGAGGAGSGEINAITNTSASSDATTGVTAGTGHTVTRDTTNSPLSPITSTCFAIASGTPQAESSTSGAYWSISTLAASLRSKKLKVEFCVTTPASGTWKLSVCAGSTRLSLSTDSSGATTLPAGFTGKFTTYVDTTSATAYTVNLTCTATASTIYVTGLIVGPGIQAQGAIVGPTTSFTPAWGNFTLGNGTVQLATYERVGSVMRVRLVVDWGSTTVLSSTWYFVLPNGLHVDTSVLDSNSRNNLGFAVLIDSGTDSYAAHANWDGSATDRIRFVYLGAPAGVVNGTGPFTWTTNDSFRAQFDVPIAEWAGSGISLAQSDVEFASNDGSGGTTAGSSYTTGMVYGPGGSNFVAVAASASVNLVTRYKVAFPTPIQQMGDLQLEVSLDGTNFIPVPTGGRAAGGNCPTQANYQNGLQYGMQIDSQIDASSIYVSFGNGGAAGSNGYGAASGVNWADFTTKKWRVRKTASGQAVGVGAASSTISGLAPAGVFASGIDKTITLQESSSTPADPTSGTETRLYMKGDKLVIQFNDGGTVRYKYLDLTGTGVTWVHSTTAP